MTMRRTTRWTSAGTASRRRPATKAPSASVAPAAFSVSDFSGTTGWTPLTIASAVLQGDGSVLVALAAPTRGVLVRFIAHGSGPTPLLAADDHAPLGAPSASGADDGIDFVQMIARS